MIMTMESDVGSTRMTRQAGEALVARWRASGLSAADFSRESGLSLKRMKRWIWRFGKRPPDAADVPSSGGFAAVVMSGTGIRIRVAGGAAIEVDPVFDVALLRRVVEALC
jgi:hypothetical protein